MLSILKCLATTKWGADRNTLLKIHEMMILSTIQYGDSAYGSASNSTLEILDLVHHKGVRAALGSFCISPNENILCEAGMETLSERRSMKLLKTAIRLAAKLDHPISSSLHDINIINVYAITPSLPRPIPVRAAEICAGLEVDLRLVGPTVTILKAPWLNQRNKNIDTSLLYLQKCPSRERCQKEAHELINGKYKKITPIYTDGSLAENRVGCGVIFPFDTVKCRLPAQTTVFS
jgi:hypothetical protein